MTYSNQFTWASKPLDDGVGQALSTLEAGMHVALIATFDVYTCNADDSVDKALSDKELQPFDHIPVICQNSIIGVLNRVDNRSSTGSVRQNMQELHESILIAANTGLLSYVEEADITPYRLVLEERRITGIVTLSDLQRLAVRPVLFSLLTYVELLLAEWLRQNFSEEQWLAVLDEQSQKEILRNWRRAEKSNLAIDKITTTNLSHKKTAALALGAFSSRDTAELELDDVKWLRNSLAHAGDYALTPTNAKRVAKTVRSARHLIQILQNFLRTSH